MKIKEYIEWLDASILVSFQELARVVFDFLCVLVIVPLHIAYLIFRCVFPFFNPFIDKFMLTLNDD
jgi:hypothetical protein